MSKLKGSTSTKMPNAEGNYLCSACQVYKPKTAFYSVNLTNCRACKIKRENEWRKENPDKLRNRTLMRTYGITLVEYNEMLDEQGGVCALSTCNSTYRLGQDHNHEFGFNRGILCHVHNLALGNFNEDIESLQAAIDYLKEWEI